MILLAADEQEIKILWTKVTRSQYERDGARYASNLMDGEWCLIVTWSPGMYPA